MIQSRTLDGSDFGGKFEDVAVSKATAVTQGSGCGTARRSVASDPRDPRFDSQHRPKFICQL